MATMGDVLSGSDDDEFSDIEHEICTPQFLAPPKNSIPRRTFSSTVSFTRTEASRIPVRQRRVTRTEKSTPPVIVRSEACTTFSDSINTLAEIREDKPIIPCFGDYVSYFYLYFS